ncbi:hypothetical protein [Cryobacterium psychrophilum]|uniref:Uncharacterized protein n=1 Tax=Cryobacterium psychrophilum TaxID=41988 RepID=A0A4Y8KS29_9MICO|nr:hypothetical protein [Cryobacterium psychrophilum]TFD82398.1 hypothetical protein E3T53_00555 [Cryobacterium psychrophilum]
MHRDNGHEIALAHELPTAFAKTRAGLPLAALVFLAEFGAAFATLPGEPTPRIHDVMQNM